jgi:osmotically-inducible protein OsmY
MEGGIMDKDTQLQREILDELDYEPSLNADEIGVSVKDGVVTLSGLVGSYAEKVSAETAVKRIHGVKAVAVELEVRLPSSIRHTDTDIAKAASTALDWSTLVPKGEVTVKVENGWVTLEGQVGWDFERQAAARAVRSLSGVRGVSNLIVLKPRVGTQQIKERIVGAFRRNADLDAKTVRVEAADGKVTLFGNVHSWTERTEAERVAWAAPGVSQVENRITVAM